MRGKDCAGEVQIVERTASIKEAAYGFEENLAVGCRVCGPVGAGAGANGGTLENKGLAERTCEKSTRNVIIYLELCATCNCVWRVIFVLKEIGFRNEKEISQHDDGMWLGACNICEGAYRGSTDVGGNSRGRDS